MNALPTAIRTILWMVRDTFRQSLATRLFWVMLGLTVLCSLFCLGVSVNAPPERERHPDEIRDRVNPKITPPEERNPGTPIGGGKVSLGFGLFKFEMSKNRTDSIKLIQLWLAGILADTAGVLLALLWTAGFLPTFLEPQAVTVLLAKPAPRWSILAGKYAGVVLFVALQAVLFVGGTWFALGFSTGVWEGSYWFAVPLLIVNFAVFYAFSGFLAVCTRSTVVSVFGTLLFWLLCWTMNFTHHRVVGFDVQGLTPVATLLIDVGYWVLPKPLDMSGIFFEAMRAKDYSMPVPELQAMQNRGAFHPELSVVTSLLFALGLLALAAYEFKKMDY